MTLKLLPKCMKKIDELRPEYKKSDFVKLERGKVHQAVSTGTSVALIDPALAKVFPPSEAVNAALLGLLNLTELDRANRPPSRPHNPHPACQSFDLISFCYILNSCLGNKCAGYSHIYLHFKQIPRSQTLPRIRPSQPKQINQGDVSDSL